MGWLLALLLAVRSEAPAPFGPPGPALTLVCPHPLKVLGTDELYAYLNKYGLDLDPQLETLIGEG